MPPSAGVGMDYGNFSTLRVEVDEGVATRHDRPRRNQPDGPCDARRPRSRRAAPRGRSGRESRGAAKRESGLLRRPRRHQRDHPASRATPCARGEARLGARRAGSLPHDAEGDHRQDPGAMPGRRQRTRARVRHAVRRDRPGHPCQPEVGVGIVPGAGGSVRLPRLVGRGRALEIILGCGDFPAEIAERYGY